MLSGHHKALKSDEKKCNIKMILSIMLSDAYNDKLSLSLAKTNTFSECIDGVQL